MLVKVDHAADAPLYAQIAAEIRSAIARGEVAEGERLPAARTLANALGVNMHTVLRAYAQLKEEGLVQMRQGTGAVVRKGGRKSAGRVEAVVGRLVQHARRQGLSRDDLLALIGRM
jgi:GntR family transcriptional regulator